jgi:glycosyltransferase involved in cell wall biosynthesis
VSARVDVLIPAYNAAATLREAVDSIRAQTVRDIRIIVVDDGSTDETPALLAEMARSDDRMLVVTRANGGIVDALNDGLRRCSAEFIARFDSDDVSFPDRFERQLAYLAAHPESVAVGGAVEHIDEHGAPLSGLPQPGAPSSADAAKAPALEPYIIHPFLMARRAAIEAVGGYRYVPNSEDSDLFWRLAEQGTLVNLPDVLGKYRVHTASISSSIVSGRVMAVGSQLGALSALRRRSGRGDIAFARTLPAALRNAATLEAMIAVAAPLLDAAEIGRLRIAAAAKLMELARYRPYEPDAGDCAFIRAALPLARALTPQNQKEMDWYVTVTAARLIRKGKWGEALTLTPAASLPKAAARVLLLSG